MRVLRHQPLRDMQQILDCRQREAGSERVEQIAQRDARCATENHPRHQRPVAAPGECQGDDDCEPDESSCQQEAELLVELHFLAEVDDTDVLQSLDHRADRQHTQHGLDARLVVKRSDRDGHEDHAGPDGEPGQGVQGPGRVVMCAAGLGALNQCGIDAERAEQLEQRDQRGRHRDETEVGGDQQPCEHQHAHHAEAAVQQLEADHPGDPMGHLATDAHGRSRSSRPACRRGGVIGRSGVSDCCQGEDERFGSCQEPTIDTHEVAACVVFLNRSADRHAQFAVRPCPCKLDDFCGGHVAAMCSIS